MIYFYCTVTSLTIFINIENKGFNLLIMWLFIPLTHPTLNTVIFVFALCNVSMSTVDYDTIFHALKEVPEGAVIQGDGTDA